MMVNKLIQGDTLEVLKTMPDESVDCVITSPPYYGLRDYGVKGQLGLEKTLDEYLEKMLLITVGLKRVLKKTGTMWLNWGDSYGGAISEPNAPKLGARAKDRIYSRPAIGLEKCLMLQNYRMAIKMIDQQQWILRNIIIWHKPNCMPSSVKDRFTVDYEPVFFFSKSKKYWFETQYEKIGEPVRHTKTFRGGNVYSAFKNNNDRGTTRTETYSETEPVLSGRNKRCVWKIPTSPFKDAHFATFPQKLIEPMVKAGCPEFICKKCGKAREKIYGKGEFIQTGGGRQKETTLSDEQKQKAGYHPSIELGYTDCHCNVGWDKGIVLDPFIGSGTTAVAAKKLGRNYLGIELNPKYIKMAEKRLAQEVLI